jgi:hypothetical protein
LLSLYPASERATTDSIPLERFLAGKKIQAEKDQHNIFYTIEKQGTGVQPKKGDYVMLHYVGRLLNGTVFDPEYAKRTLCISTGVWPGDAGMGSRFAALPGRHQRDYLCSR